MLVTKVIVTRRALVVCLLAAPIHLAHAESDKAKVETMETSIEGRTKAEIKALQTKIKTTMLDVSQ